MLTLPADADPRRGSEIATVVAVLLCVLVFLVDLATPPPYFTGIAYLLPLLVTLRTRQAWLPLAVAAATTALTGLGVLLTDAGVDPAHAFLDRSMTVFALWVTALVLRSKIRADARLLRNRLEAARILEGVNAVMIRLDPQGVVTGANARARALLARNGDGLAGRSWLGDVVKPEHRDDEWAHLQQVISEGTAHSAPPREVLVRGRDGQPHSLGISSAVLQSTDGSQGILLSGVDLTERKEAEAALRDRETLARLGELATLVAHEVNNPLGAAVGALNVLRRRLDSSEDRDVLSRVIHRLQLLSASMDALLQFSRPAEPRFTRVLVRGLLEDVRETVRDLPEYSDVEVEVEADEVSLEADEDLLRGAVLNLVLNAAQAQEGRGTVRIRVEQVDGTCSMLVSDDGPGIPEADRDTVFQPFFTTRTRGTGLGLPLVRRTARAHGGEVHHESPPEGGATFVLTLPATQPA